MARYRWTGWPGSPRVEAVGDVGQVRGAELVDHRPDALIGQPDHAGEVAAGRLAPDADPAAVDGELVGAVDQVREGALDVGHAVGVGGPLTGGAVFDAGDGVPGRGKEGALAARHSPGCDHESTTGYVHDQRMRPGRGRHM
jgi:hypothetical protein